MTSLISSGVDPTGNNKTVGGLVGGAVEVVVEVVVENIRVVNGVVDGTNVDGAEFSI